MQCDTCTELLLYVLYSLVLFNHRSHTECFWIKWIWKLFV